MKTKQIVLLCIIGLVSFMFLSGCQSKATSARFMSAQNDVRSCQADVLTARQNKAAPPAFKDETNMLLYMVVQELADSKKGDDLAACDDAYIAMIRTDGQKMGKLIDRGFGLAGVGMGVWGAAIITDGIVDLAGQSGDTFSARDITLTNTAGEGGMAPGGAGTMTTIIGGGSINTLSEGSSQIAAEKFQNNDVAGDGTLTSPLQDDSGDGSGNEAGILQ